MKKLPACVDLTVFWFRGHFDQCSINQQESNWRKTCNVSMKKKHYLVNFLNQQIKVIQPNFKCDELASRTSKDLNSCPSSFSIEKKSWQKPKSWQTNHFLSYSNNKNSSTNSQRIPPKFPKNFQILKISNSLHQTFGLVLYNSQTKWGLWCELIF